MGYREAFAVLDGRWTVETAIAEDAQRTRRFARRQDTWFRGEPDIAWLPDDPDRRLAEAVEQLERLLDRSQRPVQPHPLS